MRPQKAYQIINSAFNSKLVLGVPTSLWTRDVKIAVQSLIDRYIADSNRIKIELNRLQMNGIPYWGIYDVYVNEEYAEYAKALTPDPYRFNVVHRLDYISDRWNSHERLLFLKYVLDNYTVEEFMELKRESEVTETQYDSAKPDVELSEYVEPKYVSWNDLTDKQKSAVKLILGKQSITKSEKRNGWVDSVSQGNNVLIKSNSHYRNNFRFYYESGSITFTSLNRVLASRKWIWQLSSTKREK